MTTESLLQNPYLKRLKSFAVQHRKYWLHAGIGFTVLFIFVVSKAAESGRKWLVIERSHDFKEARILTSPLDAIYDGKEDLLSRKASQMARSQASLNENIRDLQAKVETLEGKFSENSKSLPTPTPETAASPTPSPSSPQHSVPSSALLPDAYAYAPQNAQQGRPEPSSPSLTSKRMLPNPRRLHKVRLGPQVISFPVKSTRVAKKRTISLPAGSYVKAKLLTGVEAPEGKTYPVLVQLDYAHILPNHHRLDLSGCFMIVKASGNLSIERVEMQASKMSCVSKEGEMFERDVTGFVADDKDNSFAVVGSVNSKQDRVATMAFLASVVDGVGQAIQQAQTTQQVTPLGGSQSVLTGNQAKYIAAGGAANAANMVAQWYLKQAQNLLPTINVGSGRDVWVVMQETVDLPPHYFRKSKKGDKSETLYSHFTRVLR